MDAVQTIPPPSQCSRHLTSEGCSKELRGPKTITKRVVWWKLVSCVFAYANTAKPQKLSFSTCGRQKRLQSAQAMHGTVGEVLLCCRLGIAIVLHHGCHTDKPREKPRFRIHISSRMLLPIAGQLELCSSVITNYIHRMLGHPAPCKDTEASLVAGWESMQKLWGGIPECQDSCSNLRLGWDKSDMSHRSTKVWNYQPRARAHTHSAWLLSTAKPPGGEKRVSW